MGEKTDVHLRNLARDFATLRRPYVTLADALKIIEEQCERETDDDVIVGVDPETCSVYPFDFVVYSRLPELPEAVKKQHDGSDHKEIFRFLPGYDEEKFRQILKNRDTFTDTIADPDKEIPPGTLSKYLDGYYREVIKHFASSASRPGESLTAQSDLDFITAVYHLIYAASNPVFTNSVQKKPTGNFIGGLFQSEKLLNRNAIGIEDIPFEGKLVKKEADKVRPLEIDGHLFNQIPNEFAEGHYGKYKSYYEEWLPAVQEATFQDFPEILYYPIFDGLTPLKGVLTGYLGIYCTTLEAKEKIKEYITESRLSIIQNTINAAYNKGTHNAILDSYKSLDDYPDPVIFWIENLQLLHNWESIIIATGDSKEQLWWTKNEERTCCLDIGRALALYKNIADPNNNTANPFHNWQGKILELRFPEYPILNTAEIDDESPFLQRRMGETLGLLNDIMVRWQVLKNEQQAIQQARRAAVSQVLSRNMSHNIGSHVLANLIKRVRNEYYDILNITKGQLHGDDEIEIRKLSSFLEYIMHRMDFLADIATAEPLMEVTSDVNRDVISKFRKNGYLKDFITGNDYNFKLYYQKSNPESSIIALPNDLLGSHAFYIIVENFIRNTAKHAIIPGQTFHVHILSDIDPNHPDYLRFRIYDNTGVSEPEKLADQQNERLRLSILDKNRDLRREAWGMLEMKIAAAYLRKVPLHLIDSEIYAPGEKSSQIKPALFRALNLDGNLGYEFYLHKPKEFLLIQSDKGNQVFISVNSNGKSQIMQGFKLSTKQLAPYKIISVDTKATLDLIEPFKNKITRRVLVNHSSGSASDIWKNWIRDLCNKKNISEINIYKLYDGDKQLVLNEKTGSDGKPFNALFIRHSDIPENKDFNHYEFYFNHSFFDRYLEADTHREQLDPILIESVATSIALLDERVQHFSHDTKMDQSEAATLVDYLSLLGIHIPKRENVWLNSDYNDSYYEKVSDWIETQVRSSDFLLIHIGILEKTLQLAKYNDAQKKKAIEKYLFDFDVPDSQILEKVIFISGRGKPDTIPEDFRFLNFSNLSRFINKDICKATLTQLLYSARAYG